MVERLRLQSKFVVVNFVLPHHVRHGGLLFCNPEPQERDICIQCILLWGCDRGFGHKWECGAEPDECWE